MEKHYPHGKRGGPVNVPIPPPSLPQHNRPIRRGIGILFLRLFGWRLEGTLPDVPKAVGIGAPHTSTWEVVFAIATFWALDLNLSWMAKNSLFRPPFGAFFRWLGAMPIDRSQKLGVVEQVIREFNKRDKMVMALAPEGTRKKVKEFKSGFYRIAYGANVPIVCVGIDFGQKRFVFREPFHPTGNMEADMADLRAWFDQMEPKHPERW